MDTGLWIEFVADHENRFRQAVVYPAAERRAQLAYELRLLRQAAPKTAPGQAVTRWLGERLVRAGARLAGGTAQAAHG